MKIIMFVILVCGEPDLITWHDPNKGDYMMYWNDAKTNIEALKFMRNVERDPSNTIIVVKDKRGVCS